MMISEDSDMGIPWFSMKAPSLVDLCVTVAIDNIRYLGDVGETDLHLLERILPHCTKDQLMHVENSTIGRDLCPVTDELWMKFYKKDFGEKSFNLVIERMNKKKVAFRWKQLYEAKSKDVLEAETVAVNRLKQLYQKADAQKQSRQIRICEKVPPSSNKRSWGNGPGYGVSGGKSSLMKKAKIDLLKSQEFKNLAAIRKNAVQRTHSPAPVREPQFVKSSLMKKANIDLLKSQEFKNLAATRKNAVQRTRSPAPAKHGGFLSKASGSTSNHSKPLGKRF